MTDDVNIRIEGRAGRITLTRPKALNALSHEMALAIAQALKDWQDDPSVALVLIDGEGERAFCAGGDIAELYRQGTEGIFGPARQFWSDEYRMNAHFAEYPKPVVSFLHGFVMGGGVGLGCHGSHRIVGDSSRIAMPECGIGLIPDVGGTYLLSKAPGQLGPYFGLTGARMTAPDAIAAGFADAYIPEDRWDALKTLLADTGDITAIDSHIAPLPDSPIAPLQDQIDQHFSAADVPAILDSLAAATSDFAQDTLKSLGHHAPMAMCATLALIRMAPKDIREALTNEYRYTYRAPEEGDFLEGIRAQIIEKDRNPKWHHASAAEVPSEQLQAMLAPLGQNDLTFTSLL